MKNLFAVFVAMVACFIMGPVHAKQCMEFSLDSGDVVQKEIPINFNSISFFGMEVYHFQPGHPSVKTSGRWKKISPDEKGRQGIYRFSAYDRTAYVKICGNAREFLG